MSFIKKLLPVAGAAAGFFLGPAGSAAVSSALGSGIGTLLAGGDLKDAVKNAAVAGIAGGGLQAAGVGSTAAATQAAGQTAAATQAAQAEKALAAMEGSQAAAAAAPIAKSQAAASGIAKLLTPGNLLLGSMLLGATEEPEEIPETDRLRRLRETGEGTSYVGQDVVPRYDYSRETAMSFAQGGFIEGPGTGTSDDIPAMIYQGGQPVQEARLSDGEFVMTKKAVDGAGGAARMYEMMKKYEAMV